MVLHTGEFRVVDELEVSACTNLLGSWGSRFRVYRNRA